MRSRPFLIVGFGALLVLIGLSSAALHHHAEHVSSEIQAFQHANEESSRLLAELRSEIYLFAVLLRDYLLESAPAAAAEHRVAIEELHASTQRHLDDLRRSAALKDRPEVSRLRHAVEEYWKSAEPVFRWTPAKKIEEGPAFLRHRVGPQRRIVSRLASEIQSVNLAQSRRRQQQVLDAQTDLKGYVWRVAIAALTLGVGVAFVSIARTRSLETSAARHLLQIERDAEDLRRLSLKLSRAQEDERKRISRELHDQVGQMITAARMELSNMEEFRHDPSGRFDEHMAEARRLAEDTLRTVRDMSMGLRPSILDELGLGPALRWQARDFARRSGVPVNVQIEGDIEKLADAPRTCIYRVVQEALTNCARHAQATRITVALHGGSRAIAVTIEDDGIGFDVQATRVRGLGLLGTEERVRELGGRMEIVSRPSKGALLRCEIPVAREVTV